MTYGSTASRYLIGKEDTYGSSVTPEKDVGIVTDVSDNNTRNVIRVPKGVGHRGNKSIETGTLEVGDEVTFQFQHGRILEYALGGVSHDETSGDWVHTFTLESTVPSFTSESSESGDNDSGTQKTGNIIDSFSLSIELNDVLKGEFSTVASAPSTVSTPESKVLSDLPVFPASQVTISIDDEEVDEMQNFTISLEGEASRSFGIGSDDAKQARSEGGSFTFNGNVGIKNNKYNDLINDGSKFNVELVADNGKNLGEGQRKVQLSLKDCILGDKTKSVSVGELTFVDIEGEGVLDVCETVDGISDTDW